MDWFHHRTVLYTDVNAGGERFVPNGWMPARPDTSDVLVEHVLEPKHSGRSSLRIDWKPSGNSWTGIAWLIPLVDPRAGTVEPNWGSEPGLDLRGATTLTFWVRGETGDEFAEFKFGGINPHPSARLPHRGSARQVTTGCIQLSRDWQPIRLPIGHLDLSNVLGGLTWVTSIAENPDGCSFYLDDITIDHARLAEPRLVRSYRTTHTTDLTEIEQLANIAYVYDNALAICALLASGRPDDLARARLVADALVELSRTNSGGWLYNGYAAGDLFAAGPKGNRCVRLPGKLVQNDKGESAWHVDAYAESKDVGNMSWAILALLNVWQATGAPRESSYLETARTLANWIRRECTPADGRGFTGGYAVEWPKNSPGKKVVKKVDWRSSEHMIDFAVVCRRLAAAAKSEAERRDWQACERRATEFVEWARTASGRDGFVITGANDANTPNLVQKPLDPQTWSVLAFPERSAAFEPALDWAIEHCAREHQGIRGFSYGALNPAKAKVDSIWPEGQGQLVLSLRVLDRHDEADRVLANLRRIQAMSLDAKGGMPAAWPGKADTDFGKFYHPIPHLGATAWFIMAELDYDPFSGRRVR